MCSTGLFRNTSFGWAESMLIAAIMSSTDSASVFSIFDSAKLGLKQKLRPTLELESGSNDPMAYLLVIILIGIIEGNATTIQEHNCCLARRRHWQSSCCLELQEAFVWVMQRYGLSTGCVWTTSFFIR